jgi:endonuclease III
MNVPVSDFCFVVSIELTIANLLLALYDNSMKKLSPTTRPVKARPALTTRAISAIFSQFSKDNPAPKTELEAPNPFCLLVAIVLSAQATDVAVNKATKPLFIRYNTPQTLLSLGEDGLKRFISSIGLYNSKARHVMALCERLLSVYGGEIPLTREELQTLPGVGRKTANVWLNCVHGLPTIAVDTHVLRVSNRLGLADATTPDSCEEQLEARIPKRFKTHAHHWLILHGRYVCKARKPECERCHVARWCVSSNL